MPPNSDASHCAGQAPVPGTAPSKPRRPDRRSCLLTLESFDLMQQMQREMNASRSGRTIDGCAIVSAALIVAMELGRERIAFVARQIALAEDAADLARMQAEHEARAACSAHADRVRHAPSPLAA